MIAMHMVEKVCMIAYLCFFKPKLVFQLCSNNLLFSPSDVVTFILLSLQKPEDDRGSISGWQKANLL